MNGWELRIPMPRDIDYDEADNFLLRMEDLYEEWFSRRVHLVYTNDPRVVGRPDSAE
jgi:hypothetical protein